MSVKTMPSAGKFFVSRNFWPANLFYVVEPVRGKKYFLLIKLIATYLMLWYPNVNLG